MEKLVRKRNRGEKSFWVYFTGRDILPLCWSESINMQNKHSNCLAARLLNISSAVDTEVTFSAFFPRTLVGF